MTNAPLSCGILIQHLHFLTNSVWDFKNVNGNANVAVWWEALHHRIDFFPSHILCMPLPNTPLHK